MNYSKYLALLFALLSFGSIGETWRIINNPSSDVMANHSRLILVSGSISAIFVILTFWFWRKSQKKPLK